MKLYGFSLVAVSCLSSASAFAPSISTTRQRCPSLYSSTPPPPPGDIVPSGSDGGGDGDGGGGSDAGDAYTKKLEARLAALEKGGNYGVGRIGGGRGGYSSNQSSRYSGEGPFSATSNRASGSVNSRSSAPLKVQGGSLKTWLFESTDVESVRVELTTEGRPLDAEVNLWQGPNNNPHRIRVYLEDGSLRPFNSVILTPRGPNTVRIRNTGQLEFPLDASVVAADLDGNDDISVLMDSETAYPQTIQGGALKTYPFGPAVDSVQVLLKTDGRPLKARIELLQGPNNNKQILEVYTEDGLDRPFFVILETPGSGNVVRIVNQSTVEFPMTATIEPYDVNENIKSTDAVIGGDGDTRGGYAGSGSGGRRRGESSGGGLLDRRW